VAAPGHHRELPNRSGANIIGWLPQVDRTVCCIR
jgi:hypothetical protein